MAKKKLNKKIAIVGSVVLVIFLVIGIYGILRYTQGPEKFIEDGDAAFKAKDYEAAEHYYAKAAARAKTDELKVELYLTLVDVYLENNEWAKVTGLWNRIIQVDPENLKARFGRLKYFHIVAENGGSFYWKDIAEQVSEFLDVANEDVLAGDTSKLESYEIQDLVGDAKLGVYLHLLRSRANLEIARAGSVTNPDQYIDEAQEDLEKVREIDPCNMNVYLYLAQLTITKGQVLTSRGSFEERNMAVEQAERYLQQAVEIAGDDPKAHINFLRSKPALAQLKDAAMTPEQLQSLEAEYVALTEKFSSNAEVYAALTSYYTQQSHKSLDKAIQAIEKAMELDNSEVYYVRIAANLYYRKFSIYGEIPSLYKAIEIAKNALEMSEVKEVPGPRQFANKKNRLNLNVFLAKCYLEQVLEPAESRTDSETEEWLANAEEMVHNVEQIYGAGEDPQVVKWTGMLALAKAEVSSASPADKNAAIRKLYGAYEQFKASRPPEQRDSQLCYVLAKIFKDTSESGAVLEFISGAVRAGIVSTKPKALLDYSEILLKQQQYSQALNTVDFFEKQYWPTEKSKIYRIQAYIGARQLEDAEKELASGNPDDPNIMKLNLQLLQAKIKQVQNSLKQREIEPDKAQLQGEDGVLIAAELKGYRSAFNSLIGRLLSIEADAVEPAYVAAVCNNYITEGQISEAQDFVADYLGYFPENANGIFFSKLLLEPDPGEVSRQRRIEIEKDALSSIADPVIQAAKLGEFYRKQNDPNEALVEFQKVLDIQLDPAGGEEDTKAKEVRYLYTVAARNVLDIALQVKDWVLAEQITERCKRENLDGCEGNLFAARLAIAKEEYQEALARLDESLRLRPVFSMVYMMRSSVHELLGNENKSIADIQRAAQLNPLGSKISGQLAFALYRRNQNLGDNAAQNQLIEERDAFLRAIRLNPRNWQLQSIFAESISKDDPDGALAIRQRLQKMLPNTQNAVGLAKMAMRMAMTKKNKKQKQVLLDVAGSAFEQALSYDPENSQVVNSYAEYYRYIGKAEKADELIGQSQDEKLLYSYLLRTGKLEEVKKLAEENYQKDPEDIDAVKAMLIVAQRTNDPQGIQKYSEELILLDDSIQNKLSQIQYYLEAGLVKETENKLQSFREKYPEESGGLLLEAWLRLKQGQIETALEQINQCLQIDKNNLMAWNLRGEINYLLGNYNQAIDDLKKVKTVREKSAAIQISLAKNYVKLGRTEDAVTELKIAIAPDPLGTAPSEKAITALEQIYVRLGRTEALKSLYAQTVEQLPDSVFWLSRSGSFALSQKDFDLAEELYAQAWEKSRDGNRFAADRVFDGYLQVLLKNDKVEKVFEEAKPYVDGPYAPVAFIRMAEAKLKLGDKATATEYCRKAINKAEGNEDVAAWALGEVYKLLGEKEVLAYCEEKLKADPDSFSANLMMYYLAKLSGRSNKALEYIDKCIEIVADDDAKVISYTLEKAMVLQIAYAKTSDNSYLRTAIEEHESLLSKMPNNMDMLNNLAYWLAEINERLPEALEYAKRAYESMPNNAAVLDTYAFLLYKNEKYSEAAEFVQSAIQQFEVGKSSVPAEVYEHLGMVKEKLGEDAQALAAYQQASEIIKGGGLASNATKIQVESAIERLLQQHY